MSKDEKLVSMSGAPIFRHTDGEKSWESPRGEANLEEISLHIEKHIGSVSSVFHELISDTVHVDVHHVEPTDARPFHTLVTSGMSDLPMSVPEGAETSKFVELMVTLPESWKVDQESCEEDIWYWPVRLLKFVARFPHKYDSWLGWGHTLSNGDPAAPYAENTALSGAIILPSLLVPHDFHLLEISEEKIIQFFSIVPLYEEEMRLTLAKGSDALMDKFDKHGISELIDPARKNVARKRFGLF